MKFNALKKIIFFSCLFLISLLVACACFDEELIPKYTLPYSAPGKYSVFKEKFNEIEILTEDTQEIIDFVKKVAREAGYPLAGSNLDKYVYENEEYETEISVYQNSEYFLISIIPNISKSWIDETGAHCGLGINGSNIKIAMQKNNKKIIFMLVGS